MKKVLVVWGREDGILGVYTTYKRASARAKSYLEANGRELFVAHNQAFRPSGAYLNITAINLNMREKK